MQISQNDKEHLKDMVQQKKITVDEANIRMVEMKRVLVVFHLPASVRKALSQGLKEGRLEHIKKEGLKPEVYYKKGFEHLAKYERSKHERNIKNSISSVCI